MTLATLLWMCECARQIAALRPDEQTCRPFRIRAPEMLEVLDLAIACKKPESGSVVLAVDPSVALPKNASAFLKGNF